MRKYGVENFDIQVLSEGTDDTELKNLEKIWIILLQSRSDKYGYNLTDGGDGRPGHKYTSEELKAMSESRKIWAAAHPEHFQKMVAARSGVAWNKGIHKTVCRNGHALTDDNILYRKGSTEKNCRTCHNEHARIRTGYYDRHPNADHL
jgi:hypothetical protein